MRGQTGGAVYETLEQPSQPSNDGFYNYPENTSSTHHPQSSAQNDTDSSKLYHTLEEPNLPQQPFYSTLEESTDVGNQVGGGE